MDGYVICISGKIGSGKSTITQAICALSGMTSRSTGEFVRKVAIQRGIKEIDRSILRRIGVEYISKGWDIFCHSFLQYCDWTPGRAFVIDGIRHIGFYEGIKSLIAPTKSFLVYIEIDEAERASRIQLRDQSNLPENDQHETELYYEDIRNNADIIVQNNMDPQKVAQYILDHLLLNSQDDPQ